MFTITGQFGLAKSKYLENHDLNLNINILELRGELKSAGIKGGDEVIIGTETVERIAQSQFTKEREYYIVALKFEKFQDT